MSKDKSSLDQIIELNGSHRESTHAFRSEREDFLYNLRKNMRSTSIDESLDVALNMLKQRGYACPRIYKRDNGSCKLVRALDLDLEIGTSFAISRPVLRELFLQQVSLYHNKDVFSDSNLILGESDPLSKIDRSYKGIVAIRYESKSEILQRNIEGAVALNYDPAVKLVDEREFRLLDQVGWRIADTVTRLLELEHVTKLNSELEQMNERLQKQVKIDGPTGLYNKSVFHTDLERYVSQVNNRQLQAAYLFAMDLDHFKRLNDTYGHALGDVVLSTFGKYLLNSASGSKNITGYRFGGEEMAMVITIPPGLDLIDEESQIKTLVQEFHQGVPRLALPEEITSRFTISAGVNVVLPNQYSNGEEWYDATDILLYEAKRKGRNRVFFSGYEGKKSMISNPQ
jgi:diguanylate cyclase (GGDEF)-like protein